jgi:methyl-accepting chemotaxis protein
MTNPQRSVPDRPVAGKRIAVIAAAAGCFVGAGYLANYFDSPVAGVLVGLIGGFLLHRFLSPDTVNWTTDFQAALADIGRGRFDSRLIADKRLPAELAQAFNAMASSLQQRCAHMSALSAQITALARGLADHAQRAQSQVDSDAESISAAVVQLTGSVEEVASSSVQAVESSRQANKGADEGKVAMTEALGSMDMLSGELGNARQAMQQLDGHIESIGGVLDVIRGIAEQTNMLALNAAIEAARAGEQGRGFAVVADEVRNLAGRTQQSTQEIQKMIERVQSGARNVVSVVVEGDNQAKVCEELIETACISLAEMSGEIASIGTLNSQIDQLTTRQHEAVTRLGNRIVNSAQQRRQRLEESDLGSLGRQLEALSCDIAGMNGYARPELAVTVAGHLDGKTRRGLVGVCGPVKFNAFED